MPINSTTNTASTATSADASLITSKNPKQKTTRKSSSTVAGNDRGAPKKASAVKQPTEILFDALPNPFHPAQPPFLWIDYPEEKEQLRGPVYVIRLGVGGAEQVQLSFDKGPWQACRLTSGYWWFDWSAIAPGKHTLIARMRTPDGRWFRTPVRTIEYRA